MIALKVRYIETNNPQNQLNYAKMLNSSLPPDIRITAYKDVPEEFNARYNCTAREYRYFFVKNLLDVEKMREASQFYLGDHDFRNFCKINPSNALDYQLKKKLSFILFLLEIGDKFSLLRLRKWQQILKFSTPE